MDERDERPESLERYEDPNLETLGELLDQLEADGAMDLEELDGFFTALHCAPQMVPREEYLPEIFGTGESLDNQEIFAGPDSARLVWSLIFNHWNSVKEALPAPRPLFPCCSRTTKDESRATTGPGDLCVASDCARNFGRSFLTTKNKYEWIAPIITLNYEHHPDPALRPPKIPWTDEEREILLKDLSKGVSGLYRHFAKHRAAHTEMQIRND